MDFGGWRYALDALRKPRDSYKYFVFMNSSVRGPYLPSYVPPSLHWTKVFTQMLREDGDGWANNGPIKLVGLTINCHKNLPHVQSMLWTVELVRLHSAVLFK